MTRGLGVWLGWGLILVSAVLYGYAVWSAVGNVLVLPDFAAQLGLTVNVLGWFWLILQVALPVGIAAIALLLGRKRPILVRALILLAGVAITSVLAIDVVYSIPQTSYFG